jgi:hypothetical protein
MCHQILASFGRNECRDRLTEAVKGSAENHEHVSSDHVCGSPVLARNPIRGDKHPETGNADHDTLITAIPSLWVFAQTLKELTYEKLGPVILRAHVNPRKENANGDSPTKTSLR